MTIEEIYRTADGRLFENRHEAEEHEGFLEVMYACKAIWPDEEKAISMAEDLTNATREQLRKLLRAVELYA